MRTLFVLRALLLALVGLASAAAQTYTTSVLAGASGKSGSADGTGGAARFTSPGSMAADAVGNLYLVDASGASVRKITPAGVVTTLVTSLGGYHAIAVTPSGTVYLADPNSHVIYRLAADGARILIAGLVGTSGNANGPGTTARFSSPRGLAVDAAGTLYVADAGNFTVRKIAADGVVTTLAGLAGVSGYTDGPGPLARFSRPGALAVDDSGTLYVADGVDYSSYPALRRIAPSGEVSTLAGGGYPYSNSFDGTGSGASFSSPLGLAWDATSGVLFVSDTGRHTVRRVTTAGVVTTILGLAGISGSAEGQGAQARFASPAGLAVNAAGDLLIADAGNHTVRRAVYVPLPSVATQPAATATTAGQNATFTVVATGGTSLTYQWQRQPASGGAFLNLTDGGAYSGSNAATLVVTGATAMMHGDQFRCVISNLAGTIFSVPVALTVNAAPVFSSAPAATFSLSAAGAFAFTTVGAPAATFAVTAGNFPPWASLSATTGLLTGTPTTATGSPFVFTITATNSLGSTTQTFTLTVPPPAIPATVSLVSGRRQILPKGQSLTLSATASGTGPLSYQWRRNGVPLSGATSLHHTILNATQSDAGYYQLAVNGPSGSALSSAIFVAVSYSATEVMTWGSTLAVPSNLGSVTAISAGYTHGLALRSDGTVAAWGPDSAVATVPAGLNEVVAIAAGSFYSVALKSDGTVVVWGSSNNYGVLTVPAGLTEVVAVAAGERHIVALKSDGTVVEWGTSYYYEVTGYGPPTGLSGVVGIAAGDAVSFAIKSDGTVARWGYSSGNYGALPATIVPARSIVAAAGTSAYFAVRTDGVVVFWGSTSYSVGNQFPAAGLSGIAQVGVSTSQGYALKLDGTLAVWGDTSSASVLPPVGLRSVFALSVGYSYRLVLRDASNDLAPTVVAAPASVVANLGQSVTFAVSASAGTAALTYQWFKDNVALSGATASTLTVTNVTAASVGSYHVVVANSRGTATSATALLQLSASPVASLSTGGRYPLSPGQSLLLALAAEVPSTATVSWRRNGLPIAGANARSYAIVNATPAHAGYYQAVYTTGAGTFVTAAIFVPFIPAATQVLTSNSSGVFTTPTAGLDNLISLTARGSFLAGITPAGRVVTAPINTANYYGSDSLGVVPANLDNVVSVSLGSGLGVALRADGTVVVWGYYASDARRAVPAGLTGVVAISAGSTHVLALKGDGNVVSWGAADAGATSVPVGLSQVIAVAAGDGFSLALRADGTVVGWGRNANGESSPPTGLSGVTAISAGSTHSLALRFDGTVVAWGSTNYSATAVPSGLSGVTRIAAGDSHSLALRTDGTVVGWGSAGSYSSTLPKLIPAGLHEAIELGAGAAGNSAFLRDGTADTVPVITTQPADIVAALGQNAVLRVSATAGTAPLSYRWRKAGVAIVGATDAALVLPGVTADAAGAYDVIVSNYLGNVTSRTVALGVGPTLGVTLAGPTRRLVPRGTALSLSGTSALSGTVTYQWRLNGRAIPGATLATYALPAARWADNGVYQLVATNAVGSAVSAPVYVAVTGPRQIRSWGSNLATPPAGLTDAVALAAGSAHALALRAGGTVVTWGNVGVYGLANVPADLTDVIAIAAGAYTSLALRADGTVAAWGQLNYVPAAATSVVAIAASLTGAEAIALRADGTVVVWNTEGVRVDTPTLLGELVEVATGSGVRYALRSDGTLLSWRAADYYSPNSPAAVQVTPGDVVSIAQGAYDYALYALRRNGTVAVFNSSSGEYVTHSSSAHTGVTALAVNGNGYSYVLNSEGTVLPLSPDSNYNFAAPSVSPALQIAVGYGFGLALRDPSADAAPVITAQSTSVQVTAGQSFTLSVAATGSPLPTYQWYRNAQALSGATSASFVVSAQYSNSSYAGTYNVAVTNALGTVTSADIVVTLTSNDLTSRGLMRAAIRANAAVAPLFATFTLEGSSSKSVLLRGAGPALIPFGTTDALSDPALTLTTPDGALLQSNDNWGSNYYTGYTATQLGGFAFAENSRDAGFTRTFQAGTAHVSLAGAAGSNGGIALLELFDADNYSGPRVTYLSTLAHAGLGNDVFIFGFTLAAAPTGRSFLIRALGPSLGGTGTLADPRLAVFDSANTQVAANDDWAGDSAVADVVGTAGLMPLATSAKDAALVFTPASGGSYTVRINGATGTTGRVLVEWAEIDSLRGATLPVALVSPPRSQSALAGQSATFGAVAVGKPAPTYQWRKAGVALPGATTATLTLPNVSAADAADYTVVVSNAQSSVTSAPAALILANQLASHRLVGPGYVAGSTLSVTNTLTFTGAAAGLGWEVTLPTGWSYAGGAGEGEVKPVVGATGTLGWSWTTPPASPFTFTYVLNIPADETSSRTLSATGLVRTGGDSSPTALAALVVTAAPPRHSADTDHDNRFSLTELTRVIELYNTRIGTVRTGAYAVATTTTEDGFVADATRAPGATSALSLFHTADTNRDGALGVFELTRVIELYNARTGSTRTGSYHSQGSTEDGFAPGS